MEQFDQDMRELCHQLEVNRKETWVVVSQIWFFWDFWMTLRVEYKKRLLIGILLDVKLTDSMPYKLTLSLSNSWSFDGKTNFLRHCYVAKLKKTRLECSGPVLYLIICSEKRQKLKRKDFWYNRYIKKLSPESGHAIGDDIGNNCTSKSRGIK